MLTKFIVAVVSQCIHISNHYVVHLKLIRYFMTIKQKTGKKGLRRWTRFSGAGGMNRGTHICTLRDTVMEDTYLYEFVNLH